MSNSTQSVKATFINRRREQALKAAEGKKNYKAPEDLKTQLSTYFQAKNANETVVAERTIGNQTYEVTTGCKTEIPGACTPPSNAKGTTSLSLGVSSVNGTIKYLGNTFISYLTANIPNFTLKDMEEAIKCTLGLSALPLANAMLDYVNNNSTLVTNIIRYVHGNFTVIHKLIDSPTELSAYINNTIIPQIQATDCYPYSSSSTGAFSSTGASNSTTIDDSEEMSTGKIVGITLGTIGGVFVLSAVIYGVIKKFRRHSSGLETPNGGNSPTSRRSASKMTSKSNGQDEQLLGSEHNNNQGHSTQRNNNQTNYGTAPTSEKADDQTKIVREAQEKVNDLNAMVHELADAFKRAGDNVRACDAKVKKMERDVEKSQKDEEALNNEALTKLDNACREANDAKSKQTSAEQALNEAKKALNEAKKALNEAKKAKA